MTSMLEDNQFVLSHVRNGVNEARRLFADQKLRVDRSIAAGEDAREADGAGRSRTDRSRTLTTILAELASSGSAGE